MTALAPGTRIAGRYLLHAPIGAGGMGQVFAATDEVLDRQVAVKTLRPDPDPDLASRLRVEARAAARLAHPHIVGVFDFGEAELPGPAGGPYAVPFIVMELLRGQPLAARLREGPLPRPAALRLGAQIAEALAAAHDGGVVHGDVTPANVFITPTGAKVLDFGVSALLSRPQRSGPRYGTPGYAAPELWSGAPLAPPCDVYGLGAVLHEMLLGVPPLAAFHPPSGSPAQGPPAPGGPPPGGPPPGGDLPGEVADVVIRCLAAEPAARPPAGWAAGRLAARGAAPAGAAVDEPTAGYPAPGRPGDPHPPSGPAGGLPGDGGQRLAPAGGPRTAVLPPVLPPELPPVQYPEPDRGPGGWRRRGIVAAGATAAVVVVVLLAALLWGGQDGGTGDPAAGGPGASAAPSTSAVQRTTPANRPPRTAAAALAALRAVLDDGIAAGDIAPETARRLDERLDRLSRDLRGGPGGRGDDGGGGRRGGKKSDDAAKHLEELAKEVREAAGEGDIAQARARRLERAINRLAAFVGDRD